MHAVQADRTRQAQLQAAAAAAEAAAAIIPKVITVANSKCTAHAGSHAAALFCSAVACFTRNCRCSDATCIATKTILRSAVINLLLAVCARRFAAGFELALHVAIQVRVFENACCNEVILCRVNNVSPTKIKTAVKRLRARRCVVKSLTI